MSKLIDCLISFILNCFNKPEKITERATCIKGNLLDFVSGSTMFKILFYTLRTISIKKK